MDRSAPSDAELLAEWLNHRSESAFRTLVARYAGLVHTTARRTCGNETLAAEAAQLAFITLVQKAESLRTCSSLGGWLHRTTLMQAKNLVRKSQRETRKRQLLEAAAMPPQTQPPFSDLWQEMRPLLDESLAALSAQDREALILRFYRSLSVREVGETLGIASEAAKKRIARATDRLRDKLAHRGCKVAAGSLPAVLLTGFAADVQAALPSIPLLATKALAAGPGTLPAASLLTVTTMKSPAFVIPSVVLLAAGIWIAGQFESIASLERRNALLRNALSSGPANSSTASSRAFPIRSAMDQSPIDWEEVARQLKTGGSGYLSTSLRLVDRLEAMDVAELVAALDEIAAANLIQEDRDLLERRLGDLLIAKNPELGMTRFVSRCSDSDWEFPMSWHFTRWLKNDPDAAIAWWIRHIKGGSFGRKSPAGGTYIPRFMVSEPFFQLLPSDPETAERLLAAVPQGQRLESLRSLGMRAIYKPENQPDWAKIVREQLEGREHLQAIGWPVFNWSDGDGRPMRLDEVDGYLDRIKPSAEELAACVMAVAETEGSWRAYGAPVSVAVVERFRDWVAEKDRQLVMPATITALKGIHRQSVNPYPDLAKLAMHYHAMDHDDALILPLLEKSEALDHKTLSRSLAAKLMDPALRQQYLETFK